MARASANPQAAFTDCADELIQRGAFVAGNACMFFVCPATGRTCGGVSETSGRKCLILVPEERIELS